MKTFAFACAAAAIGIAAPASAATYINNFDGNTGESGTYGNDGIATPTFTDTFDITLNSAGKFAATITSTAADRATNIDFGSVVMTGPGLGAGIDLATLLTGAAEFRSLPATLLSAGAYTLTVTGTSGGAGSYSGVLSFAAVPEPATWGLMILGFAMVGGVLRRRQAGTMVRFA